MKSSKKKAGAPHESATKGAKFEKAGTEPRVISLFSGCGGMDFGVEAAGGHIVLANDIEANACKTLQRYFKNTDVRAGDIKEIGTFPKADVVVGGYPCQSFSMAGNRNPDQDSRTSLYKEFLRVIEKVQPNYFVAENVSGLKQLKNGHFLDEQVAAYAKAGYWVTFQVLNARDYGVPQTRKRLFIVGVKSKLKQAFVFPNPTHGPAKAGLLLPYTSHGEVIKDLPLWPEGEFYERPHDPEGHFSWYYMSRNRKADWAEPSYTIVANWRHVTLHPASPTMKLTWSNLADGWKQRWDFTDQYEHVAFNPKLQKLDKPRRLSWRECARIQTFPKSFTPFGDTEERFTQIGNAVPPKLAECVFRHLFSGNGLITRSSERQIGEQLSFGDKLSPVSGALEAA